MLPDQYTQKIIEITGLTPTNSYNNPDTIVIVVRKNKAGGVDDPINYLVNPENCLILAGQLNDASIAFSEIANQAGVPEVNIVMTTPGQSLTLSYISKKIENIKQNILTKEAEDVFIFEDDTKIEPQCQQKQQVPEQPFNRLKVITVRGFRGGVGVTTVASGLAALFHDNGGKVAVVDLGTIPNAKYHCSPTEYSEKENFMVAVTEYWDLYEPSIPAWALDPGIINKLIAILRKEYRWVVVDVGLNMNSDQVTAIDADKTVVVVDSDIVQSVETALGYDAVFVYNKAIPDISTEIIKDVIQNSVIEIKTDFEGCYAALAAGIPVIRSSHEIAAKIGKLAAQVTK